ncbi:hypothetical protein [Kribbella qitaiheensis]|uniref:hypothetical protein n=1 Tax=Kribbella qitaiheensis TaxID=1544730 RepID=UPI001623A3A6|nr:hypothetical protein [Kribbella qitaiheensis]
MSFSPRTCGFAGLLGGDVFDGLYGEGGNTARLWARISPARPVADSGIRFVVSDDLTDG